MKATASINAMLAAELAEKATEESKCHSIRIAGEQHSYGWCFRTNAKDPLQGFWQASESILIKQKEGKIRPLKLTFKDEETKWNFLKRANHNPRSDGMFCKLDVNKKTKDTEFQLWEQLRGLRKEDTTST